MANPFQVEGAAAVKPPRYAPLFTNRFFTGIWTQRSPLRDAATSYEQERSYGARYDSLIGGLNVEITNRLTLARRCGSTVYNSAVFPPIKSFYEFHQTIGGAPSIKVIAGTAATVYDATGPSTQTTILTKGVGAGAAFFQGVGNYLFIGDGVEEKKWDGTTTSKWGIAASLFPPVAVRDPTGIVVDPCYDGYRVWEANAAVAQPWMIIDQTDFNLHLLTENGTTGGVEPTWNTLVGGTTADGTAVWQNVGNYRMVGSLASQTAVTYVFCYSASADSSISSASPKLTDLFGTGGALTIRHLDGVPFQIAGIGVDPDIDPQVDLIRIYRTASGGSTLFFLAEIANPGVSGNPGTWYYLDETPDADLNQFLQAPINGQNDPPPAGLVKMAYHLGRIFGVVGNRVYYSQGPSVLDGNGNTAFYSLNFFEYPSEVHRIWPMSLGALVFTEADVFIILGQGTDTSPLFSIPFAPRIGLLDYWAFDVNGSVAYFVTQDKTQISFDPSSGIAEIGMPIGDLIEDRVEIDKTYVAWHNGGSRDKALYLTIAAGTDTDPGFRGWLVPTEIPFPPGTITNSVIPETPDPLDSLMVFVNGVIQTQGVDYTAAGNLITWTPAIPAGSTILVWYRVAASGTFDDAIVPTGTINGVNTVFTLPSAPDPANSLMLFLNGVVQTRGIDYALLGTTITYLVTPPQTGDALICWYREGLSVGFVDAAVPTGAINGVNTTFTLPSTPVPPESLMLFVNGVEQKGTGFDYTLAGDTVVFAAASIPQAGDKIIAWYRTGDESGADAGWFRMNQTAAPETGLNWSPFAQINENPNPTLAGCSAVQSLQVAAGVHRLLIGPFADGPILKRDLSVFSDNGAPYSAYAVLGSIVLAKPGQLAAVAFITTDCPKTGTSPLVGVWMDEDSTAPTAPAVAILSASVNDPPQLAASATIEGLRYYMCQTEEPAWCRHMQIKFDWGQAVTPDEMLTFTVFGTTYEEL